VLAAFVHLCAVAGLAYAVRLAQYASSWVELPAIRRAPMPTLPPLSIIVPARNEERSIERCVRSLLAQRWVDAEVIVVDDQSSDATLRILERLTAAYSRLRVVRGAPLPDGWVGKPWALAQGTRVACGEWLLFTDADTRHARRSAATTLSLARDGGIDAVSIATAQELVTFWERAIVPSVLGLVLFACGTLAELNDPAKPKRALANGQYLLVSRRAYDALGGHATLHAHIAEDLAFARNLKRDDRFRLWLVSGTSLARVRMYRSFSEIWFGFTKNMFAGAQGNAAALAGGVAFTSALSVLPPVLAVCAFARRRADLGIEALACSAATVSAAAWAFGKAGLPRRLALYQPLGTAVFSAIAVYSTWRVLSGRGVSWRGRSYSGQPGTERDGATRKDVVS
jgi:chlorobactene glucosyltransferase